MKAASQGPSVAEQMSALVDDHLEAWDGATLISRVTEDHVLCEQWHAYQVIGDVLRDPALAPHSADARFLERLRPALAREAQQLRPVTAAVPHAVTASAMGHPSANQPRFHWKWLAGVGVCAVALGLWVGEYQRVLPGLAQSAVAVPQGVQPQVALEDAASEAMVRDPELDALLAAHQQMAGSTALQKPSGFLRNATYARSTR